MRELAGEHWGVLQGSEMRDLGVTESAIKHQVDISRVLRIKRAIYRLSDYPWTWQSELQALLFDAGPKAVVSRRSAARLLKFWRYRDCPVLEVTGPENHDHEVTLGRRHRSSRMPTQHVTVVQGFPCTTAARTCFDLIGDPDPGLRRSIVGREIHAKNMKRVVNDALRRRGMALGQLAAVRATLSKRGRPGSTLARLIVVEFGARYVPTESEGEDLFLELVAASGLPEPERQIDISGDLGSGWIGRVDFLYRALRLVIEIDGSTHDGPLDQAADDARDAYLRAEGYEVWRIPYVELLFRPERVMRELARRLATAA
ncbi:MAG: endonuclease domain-containing protein [Acidimicrobiales bacterium]